MERTEVLDMMGELKLFGMKAAYDETLATAFKRKHEPQRFVGDLLLAEISDCATPASFAEASATRRACPTVGSLFGANLGSPFGDR